MSGSGISWATYSLQTDNRTTPHNSVFYRPDALPAAQPTASKHWRQITWLILTSKTVQKNTDTQTQYKSEKVDNLKYSKTKLPWFSCLLQHSARKWRGLILQHPRAHTEYQGNKKRVRKHWNTAVTLASLQPFYCQKAASKHWRLIIQAVTDEIIP